MDDQRARYKIHNFYDENLFCFSPKYSQATIGNRIYIFGGRQGIDMGESSLNDLFYFDIETKTWTQIPGNDTFPAERSFHQMVSVGDNLFVFGGCGKSGRLSDLHEFDTATSKWIKHSNVNTSGNC